MKYQLTLLLLLCCCASAVQVVYQRHRARTLFVEIQEANRIQSALDEEWGRLQLEQSTWATDDRIQEVAREQLQLREPEDIAVILVQP